MNTSEIMKNFVINGNDNDSGVIGKAFELGVRSYIMRRKVTKVKQQGKTDIRFTYEGKRFYCEIKSACGELDGTDKADFIIYCDNVDIDFPAETQAHIFTREQWAEFLTGYNGRGQFIRHDAKRGHDHIQSFYVSETIRPKASKPIARYIESVLFEIPTLDEFFQK